MKTISFKYLLLFMTAAVSAFGQTEDEAEPQIDAKIEVTENENSIMIEPTVRNLSSLYFEYNYLLLVKKTDQKNNLSVNKQSGRFALEPYSSKKLSSMILNQNGNQNIKAILFIRDEQENRLIAKDSVEIKPLAGEPVEERSLLISGIVLDETKTKVGADFYTEFYSMYNQLPKKQDFIVTVSEMPYRGQTSIIQVKADQELIHEFFGNPDLSYLNEQAVISIRKLIRFGKTRENLKYEFNY